MKHCFVVGVLLISWVGWAQAADAPLYGVVFGITVHPGGEPTRVRVAKVIDARSQSTDAVSVELPSAYLEAARMKILEHRYPTKLDEAGTPREFYTYFYYAPSLPNDVIDRLPWPGLDE
jgi:hypothetical protein